MKEFQPSSCISKKVTLTEWLIYYLKTYVGSKKPPHSRYSWDICFKHILPFLGQMVLEKITAEDIRQLMYYKSVSGNLKNGNRLSEQNCRRIYNQLVLALKQAYKDGLIQKDPFT